MPQALTHTMQVNREFVLEKCRSFVDFQVWPLLSKVDPEAWLKNFEPNEELFALHLLNSFFYFSESLTDSLFLSAFQGAYSRVYGARKVTDSVKLWNEFCDNVIITHVTGESPSTTDSGYIFSRKARQILGMDENRILSPEDTLRVLSKDKWRPVVFVDDFVGSGNQFIHTWHRSYLIGGSYLSFNMVADINSIVCYCPILCTERGYEHIIAKCPVVKLVPGNIITQKYSVFHPESIVWPKELRDDALLFLESSSKRAGIPDENGGQNDWRGFNKLGLTIGFSHSVPDATIPLFHWEKSGWKPLVRRS